MYGVVKDAHHLYCREEQNKVEGVALYIQERIKRKDREEL